jgi:hypothetical protein
MKKYRFWSIYVSYSWHWLYGDGGGWKCIPPDISYIPKWYPKNALVKKHEEEILPPPSYWLKPEYEEIVYWQEK